MKHILQISLFLLLSFSLQAQSSVILEDGRVSFVSSKNVYVKFDNTKDLNKGDTLYVNQAGRLEATLVVDNKSSSSVVCTKVEGKKLAVDDVVTAKIIKKEKKKEVVENRDNSLNEPFPPNPNRIIRNDPVVAPIEEDQLEDVLFKEKIKGRISVNSYSNISDYRNSHRMRYAFSFRGYNLKNSRLSTDAYVTFRHTVNDTINFAQALKVYALSIKYDFDKTTSITLGRKINTKFSSMGAIDGVQLEKGWGGFSAGLIAGTRPDFQNYGLNLNLLQFGGYVSLSATQPGKYGQTTLGVIEQMNKGNTDRRFVYFQHSSTLAKDLSFFGSFEVDLYENINNEAKNTAQLTNIYLSLRYRLNRKWRLSASYDNRKNIIYYESYKNFIDQLIEDETRQGFRIGISHRASKLISWGINGSMRFQKSNQNPSRNVSGYVTFSKIPFLKARGTIRANILQTDFLDSQIFGARLSKELIKGKLSADVYYRWVDYKYQIGDRVLHQDIVGASLNIRVQKQLTLSLFYEGVFDNTNQKYHRFNAKIIKRF